MGRASGPPDPRSTLRRRAETRLRGQRARARPPDSTDLRRIVQELEVHQVELQMQNQELSDAQAALTAARDRYASLFDLAPVAYLVLDHTGTILEANDAACALLARPRHRLRRRTLASFVAQDDRPALARHLEEAAATVGRTRPLRVTLDGAPVRIARLETIREVPGPEGQRDYRTTMIDVTDQALFEQRLRAERTALERSQATLRELTRRLMTVEDDERRRIAADLHDDIGQRLHAVQMELALLGRESSGRAKSFRRIRTVHRHLGEVITDLEGLARHLHPKIVDDLGLSVALKAHAEDLGRQAGMSMRFRERAVPEVIPANAATCLYRVAQEALRNVHRHAGAKTATVTLARVRRGLGLCVSDGGRGFDPAQVRLSGRGLGLVTMNERVTALDGHFRIRTNPGDGTHVHAWVPLP
jgi:PAS domain S-box-containing protein